MIVWEPAAEGYLECVGTEYSGVVGLAHPRSGWMARLDTADGRRIAPVLYHTAHEAKRWVERQLEEHERSGKRATGAPRTLRSGAQDAPGRRVTHRQALSSATGSRPWVRELVERMRRALAAYQQVNAQYLDPQRLGQAPLRLAPAYVERAPEQR